MDVERFDASACSRDRAAGEARAPSESALHSACHAPAARSMLVVAAREERRLRVHERARTRARARPAPGCCLCGIVEEAPPVAARTPRRPRSGRGGRRRGRSSQPPARRRRARPRAPQTGPRCTCQGSVGSARPELGRVQAQHLRPALAERRERAGGAAELRGQHERVETLARVEDGDEPAGGLRARTSSAPPAAAASGAAIGVARCASASVAHRGSEPGELLVEEPERPLRDEHRRGVEDVLARRPVVRVRRLPRARAAHGRAARRGCRPPALLRTARRRRRATRRTRSRRRRRRTARASASSASSMPSSHAGVRDRVAELLGHEERRRRSSMREEDGGVVALHADIEPQCRPLRARRTSVSSAGGHAVASSGEYIRVSWWRRSPRANTVTSRCGASRGTRNEKSALRARPAPPPTPAGRVPKLDEPVLDPRRRGRRGAGRRNSIPAGSSSFSGRRPRPMAKKGPTVCEGVLTAAPAASCRRRRGRARRPTRTRAPTRAASARGRTARRAAARERGSRTELKIGSYGNSGSPGKYICVTSRCVNRRPKSEKWMCAGRQAFGGSPTGTSPA